VIEGEELLAPEEETVGGASSDVTSDVEPE